MDSNNDAFFKFLDSNFLYALMGSFCKLTGLHSAIVDRNGNFFGESEGDVILCKGLKDADGFKICRKHMLKLAKGSYEKDSVIESICPLSGKPISAVPIFSGSEYAGIWAITNFRLDGARAADFAFEEVGKDCYLVEKVNIEESNLPVLNEEQYNNYIGLIKIICSSFENLITTSEEAEENSHAIDAAIQVFMKFVDSSDVGLLIFDKKSENILLSNNKAVALTGCDGKIEGKKVSDCFSLDSEGKCVLFPEKELDAVGGVYEWERYAPHYGKWFRFNAQDIVWLDGSNAVMLSFLDISSSKRLEMSLSQLAFYDADTGLYNSVKLAHDASDTKNFVDCSYVFFDILSLRKINDAYGRRVGDGIIIGFIEWIKSADFGQEAFYRIDGDSFCLSFKGGAYAKAERVARIIYERCEEPWDLDLFDESYHIFCNITIGVIYGAELTENENFISLMERTLEVAKENGTVAVFNVEMNSEFKKHLMLEVSLKNCVKQNMQGFMVYYQPIANPTTGIWAGVEALCRWISPEFGYVPPDIFITEAEQLGLMDAIGSWVMETAIRDCKTWGLDKNEGFFLDVNISALQLIDGNLESRIDELLEKYDYPGAKLSLEITESMEFHITEPIIQVINKLRAKGLQVALDDFGTGYSSFNVLKSLPVTLLKTEKVFMENIENDSYLQYLLYLMIELAHAADMKLIAEGVENEEQMRFLMRNGVDYMQGYLFAKPLSPVELERNLINFSRSNMNVINIMYNREEISRLMKYEDSFSIAPAMYNAFNYCVQVLLYNEDWGNAANEVIEYLGTQVGASRIKIFLDPTKYIENNYFSWTNGNVEDEINVNFFDIINHPLSKHWVEKILKDGLIVESDTAFIEHNFPFKLGEHNIKSILIMPFLEGNKLFGFLYVDVIGSHHNWVPDEIVIFYNIVSLMASTLKKERLQYEIINHTGIMDTVLNNVNVGIYVSDLDSYELLYANNFIESYAGGLSLKDDILNGEKCYKAIHGRDEPCDNCKKTKLLQSSEKSQINWEFYSKAKRKHYRISDSIINWKSEKKAHIEYIVDITEVKDYEKKLKMYDILGGKQHILDRDALAYAIVQAVRTSIEDEEELTTCALEIDYSRSSFNDDGDEDDVKQRVREKAEELLLKSVRKDDVVGKSGENKYVICLLKCSEEVVIGKLERILTGLRNIFNKENNSIVLKYSCEFSGELVKTISPDNILGIIDESNLINLDV
ncbi:EAL domain-containing protein [Tyzzerella sp. OttesenSCG-928-J15]|nr:EAL domain-containing protein [Tyzzerella sp. OttesenSCG-928-J15]